MRYLRVLLTVAAVACAVVVPQAAKAGAHLRVISVFTTLDQGSQPLAGLIAGMGGTLYGTASIGGTSRCRCGTVYSLTRSGTAWTLHVLYSFRGGSDGATPLAPLLLDKSGALYGTTENGGNACSGGCGTVFKLTPNGTSYTETVLYRFKGGADGAGPSGALIADVHDALYGLTSRGGTGTVCSGGCGTAFELKPLSSTYHERVLYSFQGGSGDGADPAYTTLAADSSGDLFGTTIGGGDAACDGGCGTAFELKPLGNGYAEHVLHFFAGAPDGAQPYGGPIFDVDGAMYGTTEIGGDIFACPSFGGCGTVFRIALSPMGATESIVYAFVAGEDAYAPLQALVADQYGALYGAAPGGGNRQIGALFKLTPTQTGFSETVLHDFHGNADGYGPYGRLIVNREGRLYGTAIGGPYGGGGGEIFEFTQM